MRRCRSCMVMWHEIVPETTYTPMCKPSSVGSLHFAAQIAAKFGSRAEKTAMSKIVEHHQVRPCLRPQGRGCLARIWRDDRYLRREWTNSLAMASKGANFHPSYPCLAPIWTPCGKQCHRFLKRCAPSVLDRAGPN
jgi:hypothetical protein